MSTEICREIETTINEENGRLTAGEKLARLDGFALGQKIFMAQLLGNLTTGEVDKLQKLLTKQVMDALGSTERISPLP